MEYEPKRTEIKNNSPEIDSSSFEEVLAQLDFEESPDLSEAKQAVTIMLSQNDVDPKLRSRVWGEFFDIGENIVDTQIGREDIIGRSRLHIALVIYEAQIFLELDMYDSCLEKLHQAYQY